MEIELDEAEIGFIVLLAKYRRVEIDEILSKGVTEYSF